MGKLTVVAINKSLSPGRYGDGNGLYLLVGPTGGKSWIYRYKVNNRERAMGLGPFPTVSLAEAREKALECRKLKIDGQDPLALRQEKRVQDIREGTTFKECAERYLQAHEVTWKNPKHRQQWRNTLASYAYPKIGSQSVGTIDVAAVLSVLEPVWPEHPETASRLRGRIEAILDWARVKGLREGENPARWKGNLDYALPKKSKVRKTAHFSALPYPDLPTFITELHRTEGVTARALEFLILTAARTSEVLGMRWAEIDLVNGIWTIPPERMKAGKEHRVPLSRAAISILRRAKDRGTESEWVFPGRDGKEQLSNMAALMQVRRIKRGITVHGFRSTFRDWAAETTSFPNEVVEMALAHAIHSQVEAAYRRGDLFSKRRELMDEWAGYCTPMPALVAERD